VTRRISSPYLVGREAELRSFEAALTDARASRPAVLLVGVTGGGVDADARRTMARRASGIPFYAEELAIAQLEGQSERLPRSVRRAVDARLGRLDLDAARIVKLAAITGVPSQLQLLARSAVVSESTADAAVIAEQNEHLLVTIAGDSAAVELVDVRHALIREAILAGLTPSDRRALHRDLASTLQADPKLGGRTELEQASRLSAHLEGSGAIADAIPAIVWAATAAERALMFADADRAYVRVLALVDQHGRPAPDDGMDWPGLLERSAEAAALAGDPERAIQLVTRAMAASPSERKVAATLSEVAGPASRRAMPSRMPPTAGFGCAPGWPVT
jgi:hypothetical protein